MHALHWMHTEGGGPKRSEKKLCIDFLKTLRSTHTKPQRNQKKSKKNQKIHVHNLSSFWTHRCIHVYYMYCTVVPCAGLSTFSSLSLHSYNWEKSYKKWGILPPPPTHLTRCLTYFQACLDGWEFVWKFTFQQPVKLPLLQKKTFKKIEMNNTVSPAYQCFMFETNILFLCLGSEYTSGRHFVFPPGTRSPGPRLPEPLPFIRYCILIKYLKLI